MRFSSQSGLVLAVLLVFAGLSLVRADKPRKIEFNRDIRPILSDRCFTCHGPDDKQRKAKLRFDHEEGAFADQGDGPVIVRGKSSTSELYRRLTADDRKRMPPRKMGRPLTKEQIELFRAWIDQGAQWQKHWSLIAPKRRELPAVKNENWPRNPIDHFVLARLEREGLAPSPEADRATLLRRVTLDLTGLPPTPEEVDAFLADKSKNAYEKVVDRLLESPRYGERMAARWLDAARYADTNGYQSDGERSMWRWRDWVIDAYNRNMPFDKFTIEQLAGDLLPEPTLEQLIATGFNRNHRGNAEGGIIPEEYAVEYVADRVETTSTVWLGLTLGCSRCHDHKFDPFAQKEFYQLFAFFNNVPERGKAVKFGNSPPFIKAPTKAQQAKLTQADNRLAAAQKRFAALEPKLIKSQQEWESKLPGKPEIQWFIPRDLLKAFPLDQASGGRKPPDPASKQKLNFVSGRLNQSLSLNGKQALSLGDVANFGYLDRFTFSVWIRPTSPDGAILSRVKDTARGEGYSVVLDRGNVQVNLVKRWLDDSLRVETVEPIELKRWHNIVVSYDGTRVAAGIKIYVDGKPRKLKFNLDDLNQDFAAEEPLRLGRGGRRAGMFAGQIDELRIYKDRLEPWEIEVLATAETINQLVEVPASKRTVAQRRKLRAYFLAHAAPDDIQAAHKEVVRLGNERAKLIETFPTTMVMQELKTPRPAHVLKRGEYDKPGARVEPGVPSALPAMPEGAPKNRLGFARWLVRADHPLTSRVAVNRYWQMYFGAGIVKTQEDFGSQGQWPSHLELLDWLATEFVRTGWDVKAMQKLIVTSATYRQSSRVTPALLARDPDNRLLARGPRYRLPAEMIRDQALFASGLLTEKRGGPSVRPYQPAGLWKEIATLGNYVQSKGPNLYRRSLYTFWKRTVAPPSMMNFDAAGREMCVVRESRTNTPLQALNLMNDVTYVEASRVLAQRAYGAGKTTEDRLTRMFRLVLGRQPKALELKILEAGYADHLADFKKKPEAARKLIKQGERPVNKKIDAAELAAYTTIAGLILNLDETITKE